MNHWPQRAGDELPDLSPLERQDEAVGTVYFHGSPDAQWIKIGYTDNVRRRSKQHRAGNQFGEGGDFEVLALVRGTLADEQRIHAYFSTSRKPKTTEVFKASTVVPYLVWLRDQPYVSVTEAEPPDTVMEANVWLPSIEKLSSRLTEPRLQFGAWDFLPTRDVTGDDWYTPDAILECGRAALGGVIDLDPATHIYANRKVKARRFHTKSDNGLIHSWAGRIWLNPPFGDYWMWAEKIIVELDRGEIQAMIVLAGTRALSAQYMAPVLARADALSVMTGRRAFWGLNTDNSSPVDGHVLMYFGPEVQRFREATAAVGPSWIR